MKAEELMIGDYVRTNKKVEDEYYFDEYQPGEIVKVREIIDNAINPDWCGGEINSFLNLDAIEPIPLTEAILKANGFDKKWHDRSRCVIFDPKNDHVTSIVYNHHNATISIDDLPFNEVDKENQRNQKIEALGCRYVHELQHTLRLCGIDKDIVLNPELLEQREPNDARINLAES